MELERAKTPLGLDPDLLNACVSCGLCLPHCPTYRSTEEESASPRGRITMMRAVESSELAIDNDFVTFMERCVMCRGCETACPSGVQFGSLMEQTRIALHEREDLAPPRWLGPSLRGLEHHRLLLVGSSILGVALRVGLVPDLMRRRFGLPKRLPIRRERLPDATGPIDVWMYPGCVMDAWQRDVHQATHRVISQVGVSIGLPSGGACCGALHLHGGRRDDALRLARDVMASMPGAQPILVNSAGCGAAMKDYGHLLGTDDAKAFAARVKDVHEWLAEHLDGLGSTSQSPLMRVAVQDPCHLRHVQKAHLAVRTVLTKFYEVVEIADDGRCCGAGGSYSVTQPELAGTIRAQKIEAIRATRADVVASANPGCSMWLDDANVDNGAESLRIVHPMVLIDEALGSG